VSPFRSSFSPQPSVFSQRFNFSGQPRSVSRAVSCYCALLNSLAALLATPILCFQQLAHSFVKYGGWYLCEAPRRYHLPVVFAPFIFITLRIASPATRLFSHPCKTLGVSPTFLCSVSQCLCGDPMSCPLFSYSYELLSPEVLYFHNDPNCPGVWGYRPSLSDLQTLPTPLFAIMLSSEASTYETC
jgi:hypothetical protein